jgi:hypothetical protein
MLEQPLGIPMGTSANTFLRKTTRRIILNLMRALCFCMTHDVYGGLNNKIYLTQALVCESSDFGLSLKIIDIGASYARREFHLFKPRFMLLVNTITLRKEIL